LHFFHDLVLDDDEDLRTDIVTIDEQTGLDVFLRHDERLCVIKFYAPFCKACKIFRPKFHKLAFDRGDRRNTIGDIVHNGDVRFGQVEYSSKNVKLCKSLSITTFPSVLIFRGGENTTGSGGGNTRLPLSEIVCKQTAIDDIIDEMNHLITYPTVESKVKYS
jgi:thiol-disulfide isomerase/thioredoxin